MTHLQSTKGEIWIIGPFPLLPDAIQRLNWKEFLPEGAGSAAQRKRLVRAFQHLYLCAHGNDNPKGLVYSPTTLIHSFRQLQRLARWMVSHDVWRLADLSFSDILGFLSTIAPRGNSPTVAQTSIDVWIAKFKQMWDLRTKYPDPLAIDIDLGVDEIYAQVRTRPSKPWKALDDDVALALIRDGVRWVDEFGPFLVAYVKDRRELAQSIRTLSRWHRKQRMKAFHAAQAQNPVFARLRERLNAHRVTTASFLQTAMRVTQGACIAVLLLLVGFRVSELVALDHDCIGTDDPDGDGVLNYLHGPAAKKGGARRRWVAGQPLDRIVKFMVDIAQPFRSATGTKALCVSQLEPGRRLRRCGSSGAAQRLKAFACRGLRTGAVQVRRFHTHMARKTFAQIAVRRDKRMLEPVCSHLGHVYRSFTDGHYVGIDHALSKLLATADRMELARGLEHLLTCSSLAGAAAPALKDARERLRHFTGKRTLSNLVARLIEQGVRLGPCDWGYCVYAKCLSACGGDDVGPNEENRSPDVCSGCHNFAVTEDHLPWWEDRAVREELFLRESHLPVQTAEFVKRRYVRTQQVLQKIVWLRAASAES